ncbi:acetyl-CoA carboxylase biotin carboxyl carrier protein [Planctomycetota bacterium]
MTKKDPDLKKIKELIKIMKDNELIEVEIKHGDDKVFLKRSQPRSASDDSVPVIPTITPSAPVDPAGSGVVQDAAQRAESTKPEKQDNLVTIKSLLVGTFYAKPGPDSEPYVEVGSHVEPQTVICIVEAMKVMNEIKAETSGTIVEILVDNGQAVEYDQVLFKVKPD